VDQEEYQRAFAPSRAGITHGTAGCDFAENDLRLASTFRGKTHFAIARAGCIFTGRKSTLKLIVFSPSMQGEKKERCERLCEQASTEQEPVNMLKLHRATCSAASSAASSLPL
jgi:hypothetical protein